MDYTKLSFNELVALAEKLGREIETQDNRMTSHPVYAVRQSITVVGSSPKYLRVAEFLTNTAAEAFIETHGHNYADLHVYVDSGHRNDQWQFLREFFMRFASVRGQGVVLKGEEISKGVISLDEARQRFAATNDAPAETPARDFRYYIERAMWLVDNSAPTSMAVELARDLAVADPEATSTAENASELFWWHIRTSSDRFVVGTRAQAQRVFDLNDESVRMLCLRPLDKRDVDMLSDAPPSKFDPDTGLVYDVPGYIADLAATPGSQKARARGCSCHVADNHFGCGRPTSKGVRFVRDLNCPMHTGPDTVPCG